jgi:hypothetical protein
MWIKHQHSHLKNQLAAKMQELKTAIDSPERPFGFLNILRDVEHLYIQTAAYEEALNDLNNMMKGDK